MDIGVAQFRTHVADCLDRAARGEEIVIVRSGKPIARLVPFVDPQQAAAQRLAQYAGLAVIGDVLSPINEAWEADR